MMSYDDIFLIEDIGDSGDLSGDTGARTGQNLSGYPFPGSGETGMNGSSHPNHKNCEGTTGIRTRAS